jgi:hypothetical protein
VGAPTANIGWATRGMHLIIGKLLMRCVPTGNWYEGRSTLVPTPGGHTKR